MDDDKNINTENTEQIGWDFNNEVGFTLIELEALKKAQETFKISRDISLLRIWWHNVLRVHGKFNCYAMLLMLPSDLEVSNYLANFAKEIHLITGDNCLIIFFSNKFSGTADFSENIWSVVANESRLEGYSMKVAEIFNIPLTEFPCLLIFKDIRSSEHVLISLKKLSTEKISEKMREVFTTIRNSVAKNEDALKTLIRSKEISVKKEMRGSVVRKIGNLAEKTFETAIKVLLESTVK